MALDPYALTTLADARTHLNVPSGTVDADLDAILERFINESTYIIENWLDRKILTRTYTEYQDGRSNNRILLKQWPVTSVAEVWCDPSSEFTDTKNLLDATDYRIAQESEIALICRHFSRGTQNIKVVYDAGYATVPFPLQSACLWMVEWFYDMRADRRVGNESKGKNNESAKYLTDWPDWLKNQLMKWKRMEWPTANAPVLNS